MGLGILSLGLFISSHDILAQNNAHQETEYVDDGEEHDVEELEGVINQYRNQNKEVTEALQDFTKDGSLSEGDRKKILEMYSSATGKTGAPGPNGMGAGGKLDMEKFRPVIKQLNGQYGRMTYSSAKGQIQSNIEQTPAKGFFRAFPKMVDFVTHLIRDNSAMLSLLDMFKDRRKLLFYLGANIATIILGFILKRRVSKEAAFSERLSKWIFRKGLVMGMRFGLLLLFFKSEIYPTWQIVKKVFL